MSCSCNSIFIGSPCFSMCHPSLSPKGLLERFKSGLTKTEAAAVGSLIITLAYHLLSLLVHNMTCKLLDDFISDDAAGCLTILQLLMEDGV